MSNSYLNRDPAGLLETHAFWQFASLAAAHFLRYATPKKSRAKSKARLTAN
jgi:hypothetical protein